MPLTTIVWLRNDLRLHDHPALQAGAMDGDSVLPVFIVNNSLLRGRHAGSNRNRFLLECLHDVRRRLRAAGSDLIVRTGEPAQVLTELAGDSGATAVYCTADYTPYAIRRDTAVKSSLDYAGIAFRSFGGRLIVDTLEALHTKHGTAYRVFTPFWKNWQTVPRRPLAAERALPPLPPAIACGDIPAVSSVTQSADLSPNTMPGGETAGRAQMLQWLNHGIQAYHQTHDRIGQAGTSRLSPYLHFGCLSARKLEELLPAGEGPEAFRRQLAWRDFYNYVLYTFPANATQEFQERYRTMPWSHDRRLLLAWQQGKTGYPIVDACMRQLKLEGWMHNRGRLVVGSFLTKDLWLDWRLGEQYFMKMLLDGDEANNNGNWQWIASVGVDPAPVSRRLYNPSLQSERFDTDGSFVRRYVPELLNVPAAYLRAPWTMPTELQQQAGCIIGKDYPAPIVNHVMARRFALEQYRLAGTPEQ